MQRIPLQPRTIDTNIRTSPTKNSSPLKQSSPLKHSSPSKRSSPLKQSSPSKRSSPSKITSPTKRRVIKNDLEFEIYADPPGTKLPHSPIFEQDKENNYCNGKENLKPNRLPLKDVNITQCKGYIDGMALNIPWGVGIIPSYATPKRKQYHHLKEEHDKSLKTLKNNKQWFEESDMDHVKVRQFNIWND